MLYHGVHTTFYIMYYIAIVYVYFARECLPTEVLTRMPVVNLKPSRETNTSGKSRINRSAPS